MGWKARRAVVGLEKVDARSERAMPLYPIKLGQKMPLNHRVCQAITLLTSSTCSEMRGKNESGSGEEVCWQESLAEEEWKIEV